MKNKPLFIAIIAVLLASTIYAQVPNIEMVHVQGGQFMMGCTGKHSDCNVNEAPAHLVQIDGYYIAKYEVTQALWARTPPNSSVTVCLSRLSVGMT